ncbi:DUF7576 family protein [Halomicrococcus sp. NG-SE-24]|uniref:DUF7576 family protein n=1 Tax=Halomicrococcus sp. NG-SE-24 TaxID=3436928 RepID=UPI003D9A0006
MALASQRHKSKEDQRTEHASTRVLAEPKITACANCGAEIQLQHQHKCLSVIQPGEDDETILLQYPLCDADCLTNFR